MEAIKLKTHIGSDGLLKLEMPTDLVDVDAEVIVIYTPQSPPAKMDWAAFVNATYGSLADDPLERPAELPFGIRDSIE